MNMMNLDREHVVKQVKRIIKDNYEFMAYLEFAVTNRKRNNKKRNK